jgi:ribonuclease HII
MFEAKFISAYPQEIIATDEVGRGPLSGPVVIGAVRLRVSDPATLTGLLRTLRARGIRDSKALTEGDRARVLGNLGVTDRSFRDPGRLELRGVELRYLTWEMCHETIDEMNILAASLAGMKAAALALSDPKDSPTTVFIDGHQRLRWETTAPSWTEIPVIKGDSKSALIGLASVIAKEKRDRYMREMHDRYPHYGFATHFGYPTRAHRRAIEEFGPSPIHRKTFKGVREFVRG